MYFSLRASLQSIRNKAIIVGLVSMLLTISGCSIKYDLTIDIIGDLKISCPGKREKILSTQDDLYDEVSKWFMRNKKGWDSTPASYVPRIVLEGEGLYVNVLDSLVVINYQGKQFAKKTDVSFFTSLCD